MSCRDRCLPCDPVDAAGFADGPPRPARPGQGGGTDRRLHRPCFPASSAGCRDRLRRMPGSRTSCSNLKSPNSFFDAVSRPRRPTRSSMHSCRTPPIRAYSKAGGSRSTPASPQSWSRSSPRLSRPNLRRWRTISPLRGLAEQAVSYWLKAGQQALKRSANHEAMAHLRQGTRIGCVRAGLRGPPPTGDSTPDRDGRDHDDHQGLGRAGGAAGLYQSACALREAGRH